MRSQPLLRSEKSGGWLAQGLLRLALVGVLLACLWYYFSSLDLPLVGMRISKSGFGLLFILVPYSMVFLAESFAWRLSIRSTPAPGFFRLTLIRVATDALLYSLPGGVAVAEGMRPVLLKRQFGIELTEGIGSCIITKINIAVAQVIFVFVGFILVVLLYPLVSLQLGVPGGPVGVLSAGVALLCAIGVLTLPFSGPRLTQLVGLLSRIPLKPLRRRIARSEVFLRRLDEHVGRFARDHTFRFVGSLLAGFFSWLLLAVETYLILTLLGAEPTFTQAVALESVASLLRILFFFIPSGLGATEVGFVTVLVAFGFPDAITLAAAYIALKRLKEAGWVVIGYGVLWRIGVNPFRRTQALAAEGPGMLSEAAR